jgi:hypothetical protein
VCAAAPTFTRYALGDRDAFAPAGGGGVGGTNKRRAVDPREQDLFDVNTTVDLSGYYDVSDDDDDDDGDEGQGTEDRGGGASSTWHYDASNVDFDAPEFRALPCVVCPSHNVGVCVA